MTLQKLDNSTKLMITAILLQGTLLVAVTTLTVNNSEQDRRIASQEKKIDFIGRDYVPAIFLDGIMRSYDYQTKEIIATLGGDEKTVNEMHIKYNELRRDMLNMMQGMRGGMTSTTRSIQPAGKGGSQ